MTFQEFRHLMFWTLPTLTVTVLVAVGLEVLLKDLPHDVGIILYAVGFLLLGTSAGAGTLGLMFKLDERLTGFGR